MRYPWDLPTAQERIISVDAHWDYVDVAVRAGRQPMRRLRIPFAHIELVDCATPAERMQVSQGEGGLWLEWPGLDYGITIAKIIQDADAGTTAWQEPPVWLDA